MSEYLHLYRRKAKLNVKEATRHYGGVLRLCRALGVARQTVHRWSKGDIPIHYQALIELQTGILKADRRKLEKVKRWEC